MDQTVSSEGSALKIAIVELYLAIKIRSAEELSDLSESSLEKERQKLLDQDSFSVLEYIRSSIEIIMSLKIEDLETEPRPVANATTETSSLRMG